MPVNWQLGQGNNALAYFDIGTKLGNQAAEARDKREVRKATAAFAANPDDPKALNALIAASPEMGFKAAEYLREQAKARREQDFDGALGEYVGRNSMLGAVPDPASTRGGIIPSPGAGNQIGDPAPRASGIGMPAGPGMPGQNALLAFGSPQGSWQSPADQAPQLPDSRQEGPDLSSLGRPESREDAAFLRMLRADPKRALEIESKMRDRFVDRLKDEHDALDYGLSALAGVAAESWPQRRTGIVQRLAPILPNIAEILPEQFPGEEGLREIQMRGLGLKDQIASLLSADNIEADNDRADRNTDSIIADRAARRGIQRRGQDIRSQDTRRGQDMRGSGGGRGRGGSGGRAPQGPVRVKSIEEARALPAGTKFRGPDNVVRVR